MKISKNWINEFIDLPKGLAPEQLAKDMSGTTVEVEKIEKQGDLLDGVVVGKIISVEKHPNADSLVVCMVDIGEKTPSQIVCGGSNVREGMLVAVATVGAYVRWHGQGEPVEIKQVTLRGVESSGMICASDEIGLTHIFPKQEEKEIVDVSPYNFKTGIYLAEALGLTDVLFELDNKSLSHRPDLLSQYGMARELAALYRLKQKEYETVALSEGKELLLKVTVEDKVLCPRYMVVAISGITVGPSPLWMQQRLKSVGVRPVNNVVDTTNYVLMELGQPMHAFDADQLTKKKDVIKIVVRPAKKGERMITLDGVDRTLTEDMLVIADEKEAVGIAGVMGGRESEITEKTTTIIFEAATFAAASIRRTSSALGIRSESSIRFEKSLDPTMPEKALARAVELLLHVSPGATVSSNIVDISSYTINQGPIEVPVASIEKVLGTVVPHDRVIDILERLGFEIWEKKDILSVTIPTWRATGDISIKEDIIEEVCRFFGFGNIASTLPEFSIIPPPKNRLRTLERQLKQLLAYEHGYTETSQYSFVSPEWLGRLEIDVSNYVELANPIAKDRPLLRRQLVPNMLASVEANSHRYEEIRMFEVGKVYRREEQGEKVRAATEDHLPGERTVLGIVYAAKNVSIPFFDVANVVRGLGARLNMSIQFKKVTDTDAKSIHPGRVAEIVVEGERIGTIAELHPRIQNTLGIPYRTAMAEIHLEALLTFYPQEKTYAPLPVFPPVSRDIAILIDRNREHDAIILALQEIQGVFGGAEVFDVYEGKGIPEGKKSMAFHLTYQSSEKTLTAVEVEAVHHAVVELLKQRFGAEIRE